MYIYIFIYYVHIYVHILNNKNYENEKKNIKY